MNTSNMSEHDLRLYEKRALVLQGGGLEKQTAQHNKGKLTARERIELLLDPGSFLELDAFSVHDCEHFGMADKKILGDGVITGYGTVDGRGVYVFSQDFTVFGGSLSATFARKICKVMDLAVENGLPMIGLNDSGGARIHEGVASLGGYADIFYRNVRASGVIPQISLIMGPCAGGAVYSPAITDFIMMADKTSHMFITGPDVIKAVTGEEVGFEKLGGANTHARISGVADFHYPDEAELIKGLKQLLSYLPSNNLEKPPQSVNPLALDKAKLELCAEKLATIVPAESNQPYDVSAVIECIVDPNSFFPSKHEFAKNLVIGFGRIGGQVLGIVANNPQHLAGVLDIQASIKGARFVRFCDAFNIPLLTLVDVPGFLPGTDQEHGGIIKHGAKLLYAYAEASVPKITVILRKAYGGAYDVMSSKHIGGDFNFAWPNAEIAVMGAEGACNIIFRSEIQTAPHPEQKRQELVSAYAKKFANPYIAAEKGYIDAVIYPGETRAVIQKALQACGQKRKTNPKRKHGNIPL